MSQPQIHQGHPSSTAVLIHWAALMLCASISGCSGSQSTSEPTDEKLKQSEQEKLKPLVMQRATTLPAAAATPALLAKPGHWSALRVEAHARHEDVRGPWVVELTTAKGQPLSMDNPSCVVSTQREVVLPKQQLRPLEQLMFVPASAEQANLNLTLRSSRGAPSSAALNSSLTLLAASQYLALVISGEPTGYAFLANHDWVRFAHDEFESTSGAHYRLLSVGQGATALPRSALAWTAIAVLIWDRRDPADLHPDEQQALLDWLHWGGQLVVSGPESLELLRGSFLEPHLSATVDETVALDDSTLKLFNEPPWQHPGAALKWVKPWSGVRLAPLPTAHTLLAADALPLVVERRVGAGRVVVTAFRLNQNEFINWPGCEPFWNACLLRRLPRVFQQTAEHFTSVSWVDHPRHEAALVTDVRWFSRDVGKPQLRSAEAKPSPQLLAAPLNASVDPAMLASIGPGLGAWDDFNPVANAARQTLVEAAGIVVPERSFVLRLLGVYIVLLVPVNWLLFRVLGRVEWAWPMVVVLALVFTAAVTYLAQLNVGFARSRTTVAVVELPARHHRAHLTRYTALYSSLGTRYDVRVQHPTGLVLPMALGAAPPREAPMHVSLERELSSADDGAPEGSNTVRLTGYEVGSNSTGLIHSEQLYDLGGSIELIERDQRWRLTNHTRHAITGLVVAQQGEQRRFAWCERLEGGVSVDLASETDLADREKWLARFNHLRGLAAVAVDQPRDGIRLIGWIDEDLPGLDVRPVAAQSRHHTLLLAHLREPAWEPLVFDSNARPLATKQSPLTIGPDTKP